MTEKLPPAELDSAGTARAAPTPNANPTAAPLAASRPIHSARICASLGPRGRGASEMHSPANMPGVTPPGLPKDDDSGPEMCTPGRFPTIWGGAQVLGGGLGMMVTPRAARSWFTSARDSVGVK